MPFQIAGWTLTALALLLALWALFADRPRARRRCPRCWYDLASTAGLTCPECGRTAKAERALFRTRRRWRWTAAALLLIHLAQPVRLWPQIQEDGWMSTVPNTMLMHLLPLGGMDSLLGQELERRSGIVRGSVLVRTQPRLSESVRAAMIRRAVRGNVLARPIDQRWRESYGEFLQHCAPSLYWREADGRVLTGAPRKTKSEAGAELRGAVESMFTLPPLLHEVRTRPIWPVGAHPTFEVKVETWWPPNLWAMPEIHWTARPGGASGTLTASGLLTLPIDASGEVTVDFEIHILQSNPSYIETPPRIGSERRSVRYRTCATPEEATPILRSDAFDELLRANLEFGLEGGLDNCSIDARALSQFSGGEFGDLSTLGFGAIAEVLVGGETLMTHRIRWQGARKWTFLPQAETPTIDVQRRLFDAIRAGTVRVRLTSDPHLALANIHADRIWAGQIEVPLAGQAPRPAAPPNSN